MFNILHDLSIKKITITLESCGMNFQTTFNIYLIFAERGPWNMVNRTKDHITWSVWKI